jgi:glyoxylase-like metal-dependent hydrolase (beta-lactamase superfamily II)
MDRSGEGRKTDLTELTITKLSVGPYDNNAYLLRCKATGSQLLIDAANDAPALISLASGSLDAIVTTHQHGDHWQALEDVVEATGARTYAGRHDADGIPVPTDVLVDDGDTVAFGQIALRAIHLTGHTPGSIALRYDNPHGHTHLFTGDSLFPGGVGNTWGNAENFASLLNDVEAKIFDVMSDDTVFYPGHGKDSTLGAERPSLPEWRARGW